MQIRRLEQQGAYLEAAFDACRRAVMTGGGGSYAKGYQAARLLSDSLLQRIALITGQMILNFIGEKVLDLPRFY